MSTDYVDDFLNYWDQAWFDAFLAWIKACYQLFSAL